MADPQARGRFVWHDLMTTDPAAAVSFYTKVLGWGTEQWQTDGVPPYTMWTVKNTPIGGVMQMPEMAAGMPPHWIAYVAVPDTDATVKQATSLGGKVHRAPSDIPTVGRFAVIEDPQGAVIAVFTPAGETPGHDGEAQEGEFCWHELMTTNYGAALDFYKALFGWEKGEAHDMGSYGIYQIYMRNGMQLGGMSNAASQMKMPPSWQFYVRVNNADQAAERVTKNGGKILNGPMDVPGGGRIANCQDPQGGMFAVHAAGSTQ